MQSEGRGAVNEVGLDHYRRLVDGLRARGIEPVVTLYHWDLPQALQDRGGWTNRDTAGRFEDYAGIVAAAPGDRVTHWITLNEPWVSAFVGHAKGEHAPGLRDPRASVLAARHLLASHGLAARGIAETAGPSAQTGITLNLSPVVPVSGSLENAVAARRVDEHLNRWFLDPVLLGSYPDDVLEEYVRLVGGDFRQAGDLELIRADVDFLGVNYYARRRVAAPSRPPDGPASEFSYSGWLGVDECPRTDEWADGYSQRFGIVYVDYRTKARIPKQSAYRYRDVIAANAVDGLPDVPGGWRDALPYGASRSRLSPS